MVVAAKDKRLPQTYWNAADPIRHGGDGRSPTRLPAERRPGRAAAHGEEDPGLYGKDRPRFGEIAPPPPLTDAATAFLHAVRGRFVDFAGFVLEGIRSRRWASVTFQGARHELSFRIEGEGAEEAAARFLSGLHARDFALRGHLVADVSLIAEERRPGRARIHIEALTVEDR